MPVNVIDTLKPKNDGAFPIAEAADIAVTAEKRLPEALADKADVSALAETNATVAGKANASDVATATANLQGQINQIEITATAEAVVAPEVAASRVSEDGTEYSTLKERLDTENSEILTNIANLENIDNRNISYTAYSGGIANCPKNSAFSSMIYSASTNRLRSCPNNASFSDLIAIPAHTKFVISVKSGYAFAYQCYSDSQIALNEFAFQSTNATVEMSTDIHLVFMIKRTDEGNIAVSEASNIQVTIYNPIGDAIEKKLDFTAVQILSDEQKSIAKSNIGVTEDITGIENTLNTILIQSVSSDDFHWGTVNNAGIATETETDEASLHNVFSDIINAAGTILTPKNTDIIFKIVYYNADNTYNSATSWMGLEGTPYTIVDNYTIDKEHCRICIASSSADIVPSSIDDQVNKITYSGADKMINPALLPSGEIQLPFAGYRINTTIKKIDNKYTSDINPRNNLIKIENGVVVFMSPDGDDNNTGLTITQPKKTLASALGVSNVETIILLSGTYTLGTHYISQQITQEINLIANGEVVFDNGNSNPLYFYRSAYIEGVHFKGGNSTVVAVLSTDERTATFYKCIFSESITDNGLTIQGGNAYVIDCVAYGNAFDGFNYHEKDDVENHAIEINCKSYGNGTIRLDESDGQSSNATTSHDGSYIVRLNGDYKCCHGGVVADKECYSANYGCSSGISTITDPTYPDRMSNYWSRTAEMYLYDCESYGSKYDTAKVDNGKIYSNIEYSSNYTD